MSAAPGTPQRVRSSAHASSSSPSIARPHLRVSPSAIIPDSVGFQGSYPVSIGSGTAFHPRVKIFSFDGPVVIGEGCIIGEKTIIGAPAGPDTPPPPPPPPPAPPPPKDEDGKQDGSEPPESSNPPEPPEPPEPPKAPEGPLTRVTHIENFADIGPLCTISSGAHIRYCTTLDTCARLGHHAQIGKHCKIGPNCTVPDFMEVDDWNVLWGGPIHLKSRRRINVGPPRDASGRSSGLSARTVEEGRLVVMNKEREVTRKLMATGQGARKK